MLQEISKIEKEETLSGELIVEKNDRGILDQIEIAESDYELDYSDEKFGRAAVVIQRQARVMIARNNFRVALYKLILLKNIVETKVHKERMQMLFAFEQLIINTEDESEEEGPDGTRSATKFIESTGLTAEQIQEILESEKDPYLRKELEELYNPFYKGVQEAEQYFENTEDIINEEDLEESVCESRRQSPKKHQSSKMEGLFAAQEVLEASNEGEG